MLGKADRSDSARFFRFRQVSFYIEIFENFYTKCLQVRKIYLSLHSRLRKTSNTAEHGAVVQLVRMRACHARGRGFEPHPHRLKALHESEGLFSYMAHSFVRFSQSLTVGIRQRGRQEVDYQL